MPLTADFAGLLILDNQPHEEIKHNERMNEAAWTKLTSKEEIFNQLCQALRDINEEVVKLTTIKQNLENKLNAIQKRWLNMKISWISLEKKKYIYAMRWFRKQMIIFQLDRQEQYKKRKYSYLWRRKRYRRQGWWRKILFKIADELEIDLQNNDIQRVHRLGQKRPNKEKPRP